MKLNYIKEYFGQNNEKFYYTIAYPELDLSCEYYYFPIPSWRENGWPYGALDKSEGKKNQMVFFLNIIDKLNKVIIKDTTIKSCNIYYDGGAIGLNYDKEKDKLYFEDDLRDDETRCYVNNCDTLKILDFYRSVLRLIVEFAIDEHETINKYWGSI